VSIGAAVVVVADLGVAAVPGWWFFGPRHETSIDVAVGVQTVRVTVSSGPSPSRVPALAGVPMHLISNRQESGG
jgi:Cu+-exporting ATPase